MKSCKEYKKFGYVLIFFLVFEILFAPISVANAINLELVPGYGVASRLCDFSISIDKFLEDGTEVKLVEDITTVLYKNEDKSQDAKAEFLKNANKLKFQLFDDQGKLLSEAKPQNGQMVFSFKDECEKWSKEDNKLPEGYAIVETDADGDVYDIKYELTKKNDAGQYTLKITNPIPSDEKKITLVKKWDDVSHQEHQEGIFERVRFNVGHKDGRVFVNVPVESKHNWTAKVYLFDDHLQMLGENLENISIEELDSGGFAPIVTINKKEAKVSNLDKIRVIKKWVGDTPAERPKEIKVHLFDKKQDKIVSSSVIMKPNGSDEWLADIPINKDANISSVSDIIVVEDPILGYTTEKCKWNEDQNALVFSNRKEGTLGQGTKIPVVKKWLDAGVDHPKSVTLKLLIKEKNKDKEFKVLSETIVKEPNWQGYFVNVPADIGDSSKYEWSIIEEGANGFVLQNIIYNDGTKGFEVSNKKQEYVELIKDDHFAYMTGYPDGSFRPETNITRAEVTVIFSRLMVEKMYIGVKYPSRFPDVSTASWYADNIGHMEKFNIIRGYPDGTFKPDRHVTRAELAAIVSRFEKLTPSGRVHFKDVPPSYWAKEVIDSAVTKGWFAGYEGNIFKPNEPIKRAEVVAVVNRMLERKADIDFIKNHPLEIKKYTDLNNLYWAYYDIIEASNAHDFDKTHNKEKWLKIRPIV